MAGLRASSRVEKTIVDNLGEAVQLLATEHDALREMARGSNLVGAIYKALGNLERAAASGTLKNVAYTQRIKLTPKNGRYVKFVIKTDYSGSNFGSAAEMNVELLPTAVEEDKVATPQKPTVDDNADTYTIPDIEGVVYKVDGKVLAAGSVVNVGDENVTVTVTAETLAGTAKEVGEASIVSRTGGAPTLAVGLSQIMHSLIPGEGMASFWYHFAIMFEALFILTSVDAGTRVARFMASDALGNVYPRFRDLNWRVGAWITTGLMVAVIPSWANCSTSTCATFMWGV